MAKTNIKTFIMFSLKRNKNHPVPVKALGDLRRKVVEIINWAWWAEASPSSYCFRCKKHGQERHRFRQE